MAWKIIGILDSRNGASQILPEYALGAPNHFENFQMARTVSAAMMAAVERNKIGLIRYLIVPAIDPPLMGQVRQQTAAVAPRVEESTEPPAPLIP